MAEPAGFDLIVFDFDGTLVDSNTVKRDCFFRIVADRPGGSAAVETALTVPGRDRYAITAHVADLLGMGEAGAKALADAYTETADAAVSDAPAMPGATELLADLNASGRTVHLSSATPLTSLTAIIGSRGWRHHFAGLHGRPATKPETLATLMAQTGIGPDRTLVIGDGPDDRDSAAIVGAGFRPVGDRLPGPRVDLHALRAEILP